MPQLADLDTPPLMPEVSSTAADAPRLDKGESLLSRQVSTFFESSGAVLGLTILLGLVLVALLAPLIAPQNP